MPSNREVTEIADGTSAVRLILRITQLVNGEQPTGPTIHQVVMEGITGSPEGRALGSPGDVRVRRDVPQIWQKITGVRTLTGWQLLTGGGVGVCNSLPQPIAAGAPGTPGIDGDAARCDHEHPVPTSGPVTVTGATNGEGVAGSIARSDHQHRLEVEVQENAVSIGQRPTVNFTGAGVTVSDDAGNDRVNVLLAGGGGPSPGGVPDDLAVGQAGAAGVSLAYAREDHDHAVSEGTPVTATGTTNSVGVATTFPRSDHLHRIEVEVQDDAVAIGQRPRLNFTGAGVTVSDDGGNDRVNIDVPGGAGAGSVLAFGNDSITTSIIPRYLDPWGDRGTAAPDGTLFRIIAPRGGTLRNLFVRHGSPAGNGNPIVYTVRINGVASVLSATLASTAASGSDTLNAVAVAQGDEIDLEVTKALDIGVQPGPIQVSMEFSA